MGHGMIILVGAGDHGRGTLEILRARLAAGLPAPQPLGFVDDGKTDCEVGGLPIMGAVRWLLHNLEPDVGLLLAIAGARAKQAINERLGVNPSRWETAIHPSAIFGAGTVVEPGAIVNAGVISAYDVQIGRHTTINLGATLGHNCSIGDYATVAPGVNLAGHVKIGTGAEVQTNSTVVPGVSIGEWARVGPGSVVLKDVPAGALVFGNPARLVPRMKRAPSFSAPGSTSAIDALA